MKAVTMKEFVSACRAEKERHLSFLEEWASALGHFDFMVSYLDAADKDDLANALAKESEYSRDRVNEAQAIIDALDLLISHEVMPASTFSTDAAKRHPTPQEVIAELHRAAAKPATVAAKARTGLRANLSAADIKAIRADKRAANLIAGDFGISRATVSNIKLAKGCYA